ncbi:MAG: ArnT family glycosyltransferase [Vicinamibacterales bacterium]
MRGSVPTLLLLAILTFFVGLGRPAITDSDEGYYAEASREMVESGDWLTPRFNYADRWQKPVLYYWLTSALYVVTGPTEWSARAWSALSGVGLVLLTWLAARRLTRREDAAFLAGAIVATCYGYFTIARLALPDLPLTFCITLAIWAALDRRWALAGVAAGLGFLMKGPVGVIIPAIVLLPIWWRERSWPSVSDVVRAGVVAIVVGWPWYIAMIATHGWAYVESFFVGDNLERFATTRYNDPRSFLFYVPIVVGGLVPWAMYLLVLPWRRTVDVVRRRACLTLDEWRLAIWAAAPFIFYTLSIGKQPRYVLPVLPPLAILLAASMARRIAPASGEGNRGIRGLAAATWLTVAMFIVAAILLYRARPLFIMAYPALSIAATAALAACGAALAWVAVTTRWSLIPPVLAGTSAVFMLAVQFGALSGVRPEPVEEVAALIRANRTTERIGEFQVFVRNLTFYTGVRQTELFNHPQAREFVSSAEPVLLVVRERDLQQIEALTDTPITRLGEVRYLDTANIRLRNLLAPLPDQDIETIVLVRTR